MRAVLSRFQRWLLDSPRVPIRVDVQSERFVYLNVHARPVLIEENPDTWVKPIDYDADGLPNG